ncbi:MAG: hypothetical protein GKR87_02990 [Kiritimatiellae bacterium]|nr:hypothetical protein [Kiritimatiellia bacterium]
MTSEHRKPKLETHNIRFFYDELILYLRQHLTELKEAHSFTLIDSLLSNKPVYKTVPGRIIKIEIIEHKEQPAHVIKIRIDKTIETFIFAQDKLRTLLEWRNTHGEFYRLRKSMFVDYWNKNRPGDEKLLYD